ncbi:acyl-CoA dehydrogenase family protein, partial [Thermodesulfobacteriota bacterium]
MKFSLTAKQEAFRKEIRDFLTTELNGECFFDSGHGLVGTDSFDFSKKMAERGWIGMTWPKEYGGQERTYVEKMILSEEMCKVHAPVGYHFLGDRQVGPGLIEFGSDWQKEYFLPRIARAEEGINFCLLFSEPDAGSDLVAITTSAEKDGDFYVINGQKVWSSRAHKSRYGWLLAKTRYDEGVPAYKTCSEFIIDMETPGITVQPILGMPGEHCFNEVFFDDVRVHKKYLVGQENEGFKQIMAQVDYERAGIERLMQNYHVYAQLIRYFQNMDAGEKTGAFYEWAKDAIAQLEIEFNAGRLLCYMTSWFIDEGKKPTSQAALCKAFCTQYEQRLNDVA